MSREMDVIRRHSPPALDAGFATSGVLHFVRPETFAGIVPAPEAMAYLSGAAELMCAAGLFARQRWAAAASVVLLVAILPAFQSSPGSKSRRNGAIVRSSGMQLRRGLRG